MVWTEFILLNPRNKNYYGSNRWLQWSRKIELSSWLHILKGDIKEFLNFIKKDKSLIVSQGKMDQVGHRYIKEKDFGRLCSIVTDKRKSFYFNRW